MLLSYQKDVCELYSKLRKPIVSKAAALSLAAIIAGGTAIPGIPAALGGSHFAATNAYAATAETTAIGEYHIVALGDSLTVGYTNGMEKEANPAPYGYVERVYEQALFQGLRASVSNYGILGLTTAELDRYVGAALKGEAIKPSDLPGGNGHDPRIAQLAAATPQLFADVEKADLVVMTIGSNDFLTVFQQFKSGNAEQLIQQMLPEYEKQLETAVRAVIGINPHAEIVISDLYNPAPNDKRFVSESDYKLLAQASADIRTRIEAVVSRLKAEGYNTRVAYVADDFVGKEVSYTTVLAGDFHPNNRGYEVMGKSFAEVIWGAYRVPSKRDDNVPISVVVAGKELQTANKPVLKNSKTYVPMRDITDAMGAKLLWNNKTRTATVTLDGKEVAFTIGAKTMTVDGKPVPIETPAYLQAVGKESKTYLPLAALSDGLGFQVVYRGTIKTAFINK
ncbi:copper amine oxidase [Paenibacillus sp. MMS18-CY102]|nr:copper amine oxidase [Paenibacillus sp. MMS18-CY102]